MIEHVNSMAANWWDWMWPMFWQVGLLISIIAAADLLLRKKAWPQLRYALWLLVLVKLVLPPGLSLSTSITARVLSLVDEVVPQQLTIEDQTEYPTAEQHARGYSSSSQ